MAESDYYKKFKDPKWQKKRLRIMERDEWMCRMCSKSDKTLNVHHLFYVWGCDPWEYSDKCLLTLCGECHTLVKDIDFAKLVTLAALHPGQGILDYVKHNPANYLKSLLLGGGGDVVEQSKGLAIIDNGELF